MDEQQKLSEVLAQLQEEDSNWTSVPANTWADKFGRLVYLGSPIAVYSSGNARIRIIQLVGTVEAYTTRDAVRLAKNAVFCWKRAVKLEPVKEQVYKSFTNTLVSALGHHVAKHNPQDKPQEYSRAFLWHVPGHCVAIQYTLGLTAKGMSSLEVCRGDTPRLTYFPRPKQTRKRKKEAYSPEALGAQFLSAVRTALWTRCAPGELVQGTLFD